MIDANDFNLRFNKMTTSLYVRASDVILSTQLHTFDKIAIQRIKHLDRLTASLRWCSSHGQPPGVAVVAESNDFSSEFISVQLCLNCSVLHKASICTSLVCTVASEALVCPVLAPRSGCSAFDSTVADITVACRAYRSDLTPPTDSPGWSMKYRAVSATVTPS